MTVKREILKSASIITLITVISRICGYLRDQRVALLLGTSPAADSFVLAYRLPSLVRRMANEGSFGASFIPVFSGVLKGSPRPQAWRFAQKVFWDMAVLLAVLAGLGTIFSSQLIHLFTIFGGRSAQWDLAIYLNRIIFPAVLFIGLASVAAAILNSFHVFALPTSTSIAFNLVFIFFSLGIIYRPILRFVPGSFQTPAVALAIGIFVGGLVQLGMQIPALVRRGMPLAPALSLSDPGVQKVGWLMLPSFFGMGVYQINLFVDTLFATSARMPPGSITSLYIADRIMQLVLGSYAIAISTVLLPTMSHQAAAGKLDEMKQTFGFSLRIVSFLTIPAAVGLILLRRPIVQVLFQHGRFASSSTLLTAHALFYYSLGLPAYAAIKLITSMYYSSSDTMTPARVGAWALVLNIVMNAFFLVFLFRYLTNGSPALASSITAYFNFFALFYIYRKRYGRLGATGVVVSLSKIATCAAAMAATTWLIEIWGNFAALQRLFAQAGFLAGAILVSAGAYLGLAWVLRCEELPEFFLLLRRGERNAASAAELGF